MVLQDALEQNGFYLADGKLAMGHYLFSTGYKSFAYSQGIEGVTERKKVGSITVTDKRLSEMLAFGVLERDKSLRKQAQMHTQHLHKTLPLGQVYGQMSTTAHYHQQVVKRIDGQSIYHDTDDNSNLENRQPSAAPNQPQQVQNKVPRYNQQEVIDLIDVYQIGCDGVSSAAAFDNEGDLESNSSGFRPNLTRSIPTINNYDDASRARTNTIEHAAHVVAGSGKKLTQSALMGPASNLVALDDRERTRNAMKQCWMKWLASKANRHKFVAHGLQFNSSTLFKEEVNIELLAQGIAEMGILGGKTGIYKAMKRLVQGERFVGYELQANWQELMMTFDFKQTLPCDGKVKWNDCVKVIDVREVEPRKQSSSSSSNERAGDKRKLSGNDDQQQADSDSENDEVKIIEEKQAKNSSVQLHHPITEMAKSHLIPLLTSALSIPEMDSQVVKRLSTCQDMILIARSWDIC